jgi:hypothetical protein
LYQAPNSTAFVLCEICLDNQASNPQNRGTPAINPGSKKGAIVKSLMIVIGVVAMLAAVPSFACGPTAPSSSSTTTTATSKQIDPVKRQRWVVKRAHHLKQQQEIDRVITNLDAGHQPSFEVKRQRRIDRFEYLMLKNEMGKLTDRELRELMLMIGRRSK